MKALKKDTLKNGDVFKISFLPRGDDDVPRHQWQTSFRKAHSYLKFLDIMQKGIRTASTEFASVFVNINGESYEYKGEDDRNI